MCVNNLLIVVTSKWNGRSRTMTSWLQIQHCNLCMAACCVPRLTQPSTLPGTVKWLSVFGLSNNKMAMVDVGPADYRRTYSPSRLAWSDGWRPLGAALRSSNEPSEFSQWLCHDDSTINVVLLLLLLTTTLSLAVKIICIIVMCGCIMCRCEQCYQSGRQLLLSLLVWHWSLLKLLHYGLLVIITAVLTQTPGPCASARNWCLLE